MYTIQFVSNGACNHAQAVDFKAADDSNRTQRSSHNFTTDCCEIRRCNRSHKTEKIYCKEREISRLTFLLSVSPGRRSVSLSRNAGFFFGLDVGVCTAQHLMNAAMNSMTATPISIQAHQ